MKRRLYETLVHWKNNEIHKPVLIRGARQVGKSYLVREFGKSFDNFVEINFDFSSDLKRIFLHDLDPHRIIKELSLIKGTNIIPRKTLLFFDEIQECPEAIKSLRYFYEKMPELHLIGAGSLLNFTLEQIGLPVGRVIPLYLYPISFLEFIEELGEMDLLNAAEEYLPNQIPQIIHIKLMKYFGEYISVGGMPEILTTWIEKEDFGLCRRIQNGLIDVYRTDFQKYAKSHQIKYVDLLYHSIPHLVSKKFLYSSIESSYQSRELKPALDLLEKAGIIHRIFHSSVSTSPIKAGVKLNYFKVIFSDIGLMQAMLNKNNLDWIINPLRAAKNSGEIIEAYIGQEMLACQSPHKKGELFYWAREKRGASAEIDYLFEKTDDVIPIEVKAGKSTRLKSLEIYLKEKKNVKYGIHFSQLNSGEKKNIKRIPLYLAGKLFTHQ
jgi:uncharacterized protein